MNVNEIERTTRCPNCDSDEVEPRICMNCNGSGYYENVCEACESEFSVDDL